MSAIIYFAFVPIIIFGMTYLVIETMEKGFHKIVYNKSKIYIFGGITTSILIIIIVILSLTIHL